MFPVSQVLQNKAAAAGVAGWIDDLPDLVAALAAEWAFTPGDPIEGGTESLVLGVTLAGGTPAVLKLLLPGEPGWAANEITVLRLAGGRGCPRLFRADVDRGAMLMERLGRPLSDLSVPIERRHEILCAAAARLWRPVTDPGLPTGAEKGRWLAAAIERLWDALDHPCTEAAVEHALRCAERRVAAHDDERAMLVHGDVHQWNTLESPDGFALVDPDGLHAEPEYDLGIIMREDPVELLAGPWERAHRLADLTGRDATATWEWGVVERVSTGLLCTQIDLQPFGRDMLHAADVIALRGS